MTKPRAKTAEEIRREFIQAVRGIAQSWAKTPGESDFEKCMGTAFSILCALDGVSGSIDTGFLIVADPHPDDKQFCIDEGENWYERGTVINPYDSEFLHDQFYSNQGEQSNNQIQ